jgi:hypothetical protein
VAIGVAGFAAFGLIGWAASAADDGFPGSLDGLGRIRSPETLAFEDSLDAFEFGDLTITGAMYGGADGRPLLVVERIEGPEEQVGIVALDPTFDGVVFGFENAGAGDIDRDASVHGHRSGFDIICAPAEISPDATTPDEATVCGWKGRMIGVVFDLRGSDANAALDVTGRIAAAIEAA